MTSSRKLGARCNAGMSFIAPAERGNRTITRVSSLSYCKAEKGYCQIVLPSRSITSVCFNFLPGRGVVLRLWPKITFILNQKIVNVPCRATSEVFRLLILVALYNNLH